MNDVTSTHPIHRPSNALRIFRRKAFWWALVLALFAGCVAIKVNGSSVGMWQLILHEPAPTPGLLFFTPKGIRRDEWWIVTPAIISQARHSPAFPVENTSLGGGRAPLLMSIPVAYYTTLFRPQLWGFFIFDLERGFSFYWCCKIFGLILGSIFLLRAIDIKSWGIVIFGTAWIFFSSFVQWWFSTPAMLPEMLACWAMLTLCALQFFCKSSPRQLILAVCGFVFFGINFLLFFYPGFQVPLLYFSIAIVTGVGLSHAKYEWKLGRGLSLLGISIGILVVTLIPFWVTVRDTIDMVAHTAYPGVYRNSGGSLSFFRLFSGVLGFFEAEDRVPYDYDNICEASNFYPLWVLALGLIVAAAVRKRALPSPLMLSLLAGVILLALYCTVPMPLSVAHWSLLGLTTEERLLLGIGIGNILISCLFLDTYQRQIIPRSGWVALFVGVFFLGAGLLWLHPVPDKTWTTCIVLTNAVIGAAFVWERARSEFLIGFAALVALNGVRVNPVMRGLEPLLESHAFKTIDKIRAADPNAHWIMYEDTDFAEVIIATGAPVFNGTKIVPDLETMHQLDPARRGEEIYNRYGYISVGLPEHNDEIVFDLVTFNGYQLTLPPELPFLRENGYRYIVFARPWLNPEMHGFSFLAKVQATGLYIYKRGPASD